MHWLLFCRRSGFWENRIRFWPDTRYPAFLFAFFIFVLFLINNRTLSFSSSQRFLTGHLEHPVSNRISSPRIRLSAGYLIQKRAGYPVQHSSCLLKFLDPYVICILYFLQCTFWFLVFREGSLVTPCLCTCELL